MCTGKVFTCNHTSTQRGESINSLIKERGNRSKELRKYNLYDLVMFIQRKVAGLEENSLSELCKLIEAGSTGAATSTSFGTNRLRNPNSCRLCPVLILDFGKFLPRRAVRHLIGSYRAILLFSTFHPATVKHSHRVSFLVLGSVLCSGA